MRFLPTFVLALSLITAACGKSSSNKGGSVMDFTKFDLVQFKSAAGIGISGTRYDLVLAKNTLTKYEIQNGGYTETKSLTMTTAEKNSLMGKLQKVSVQTWDECSTSVCSGNDRASIWMELPNTSPASYYFSNKGDCTCSSIDKDNKPTLQYAQMRAIYDEILSLL